MPSLIDWNWYELMLVQALSGVISPNFRMVTLNFAGDCWIVEAWLLEESQQDSEEFYDAIDEFSIYIEDVKQELSACAYQKIVGQLVVGGRPLRPKFAEDTRVVFRRREA
ncbi:hypothetical protein [Pseudovibrio exalbescens]|uniref:Uncharacterized protein n=1 Tax=Pseudovibrio exalbescens TaxID=197461 RepID=A0A1U7JDI4_9HYPH|nr:hypothetical protein [Pseudovibrio exalbescens]OKL42765.1 hypothetical protein A3843_00170 [Pseudovibrio exalbescens]